MAGQIQETVILDFQVDERDAVQSISTLKQANTQLRKERDSVNISTVKGQEAVQKLNKAIDDNNKKIKDNSDALTKQRQNVGNYSKSIEQAAGNLKIMGTNVGQLGTKLSSFANPLTAAVGIVGALGAAYLKSAAGAEDFAKAQGSINALLDQFINRVGDASDAGFFETLSKGVSKIAIAFTSNTKEIANQRNLELEIARVQLFKLRGLKEEAIIAAQKIKDTEREAENQRRIRDDASKTQKQRLDAVDEVEKQLNENEKARTYILTKQIRLLYTYGEAVGSITKGGKQQLIQEGKVNFELIKDLDLRIQIRKVLAEVSDIQEEIKGKQTENIKAQESLLKIEQDRINALSKAKQERLKILKEQEAVRNQRLTPGADDTTTFGAPSESLVSNDDLNATVQAGLDNADNMLAESQALSTKDLQQQADERTIIREGEAEAAQSIALQYGQIAGALSAIAEEGTAAAKVLALVEIAINSGVGISKAVQAGAGLPFPANLAAILSGVTAVLAGIAQAKSALGFAEGGYTGHGGKYEPAGIVHRGEWVAPQSVVNSAAAQPHLRVLERMRTRGYADGGFVTNTNTIPAQQNLIMANVLKRLPPPVVSVVEVSRAQNRVRMRETMAKT